MAREEDIEIEQGADFTWNTTATDAAGSTLDVSGGTAILQARPSADSTLVVVNLATGGAGIALGGSGAVTVTRTGAQTAALPAPRRLVYDLFVTLSGGAVHRVKYGELTIVPRVSRT